MNIRIDRQIDRQTEFAYFTYMWGSLRLAPITFPVTDFWIIEIYAGPDGGNSLPTLSKLIQYVLQFV